MADMLKIFTSKSPRPTPPPNSQGGVGFDNARENIDPHLRAKALSVLQGTIEATPSANKDIVNKAYCDGNVNSDHSALSNLDYAHAGHTGFEPAVTKQNVTAGSSKISLGGTPNGSAFQAFSIDVAEVNINHANLSNLAYAVSGHTGFEPTLSRGNVTAGSTKISLGGTPNNAACGAGFSIDVAEGNINHNNLLNYVANQHIDWTNTNQNFLTTGTVGGATFTATNGDINIATAGYALQFGGVDCLSLMGTDNLYLGLSCGNLGVSTGAKNVTLGKENLNSLTSGTENISSGYRAMYSATQASSCVALGAYAGYSLTIGTNHILIGYKAGYNLTTQSQNVLIGYKAGENLTDTDNVAIGYNSLNTATTAAANLAIGSGALFNLTTGDYNSAVGGQAGINLTTGSYNYFAGYNSGNQINTGSSNICIGFSAGPTADQSSKLYINPAQSDTPLIFGDFAVTFVTIYGDLKSPDTKFHYFGTFDVVSITFSGIEWIFNCEVTAPNGSDLIIDAVNPFTLLLRNGAKVFQLEYKGWAELEPGEEGWATMTSPAKLPFRNDGLGSVGVVTAMFGAGQDQHLYGSTKLSGQYEENTDILPAVNWSPLDNANANVCWELEYTAQIPGLPFPITTISRIVVSTNATQYILNEDFFPAIPGNLIRYVIDFRISRIGTADNYLNWAALHGVAFYNSVDRIGSRLMLTK